MSADAVVCYINKFGLVSLFNGMSTIVVYLILNQPFRRIVCFLLVSLFDGISTFVAYLMPNPSLLKNSSLFSFGFFV